MTPPRRAAAVGCCTMKRSELLLNMLRDSRVIALLAPERAEQCVQAWEALEGTGVILEIALRTPVALEGMGALRARYPDALFLAGTVLMREEAEKAIEAGAAGIVSPDYFPDVVECCARREVMCIPGGMHDAGKQLVQKANLYGCTPDELRQRHPHQWVYKCFPAMTGGLAALDAALAWKSVYPDLAVVYTGGVTVDNIAGIVRRDPDAIVCGSALTRDVDDAKAMRREAERWVAAVERGRTPQTRARPAAALPVSEKRPTIVTFGELMLRLSPPRGRRLGQTTALDAGFGGAEANVAAAVARWGARARFVSAVPANALGDAAIDTLRAHAIDTTYVFREGERIGVYYLEHGASQRPSTVVYDRVGSAVTGLAPGRIDWSAVFENADWFHVTGITPALGVALAETLAEAVRGAKARSARVSLDINYRGRLWSADEARRGLVPLLPDVDLLISNEADIPRVFGIGQGAMDNASGDVDLDAYEGIAREMAREYGIRMIAITLRQSTSASDNTWSACLLDGDDFYRSRRYAIHVVDRVGGGDAFAAGLIWTRLSGRPADEALEFAVAASCLKQTIEGDFSLATREEVEALARGGTSGRIRR